jgi:hypothetical protein
MKNAVSLFTSDDGLNFSFSKDLYPEAHDPFVIPLGDGYRLYAVETPLSQPQAIKYVALMDTSPDGLTWNENKSRAVFLDQDGTRLVFAEGSVGRIGDFSGVVMNGKLRLFSNYRKTDERGSTGIAFYDLLDPKDVPASISSGADITNQAVLPPPGGAPAKPSPADRLKQLNQLLDQGLINQEEYDQKKQSIIDSI